jgi:hypothetical protein
MLIKLHIPTYGPPPPHAVDVTDTHFWLERAEAEKLPAWGKMLESVKRLHVLHGKVYDMPEDFDVEAERRRLKSGGCCGQPSE